MIAWLALLLVFSAASAFLFGLAGFRAALGMAVFFVGMPLVILLKTKLDLEEKIMFSLFIGLGLSSLFVWAINQALPSFRLSIAISLLLCLVLLRIPRR